MTTEEELVAWGKYNADRGLDVSLAVYREVMAAKAEALAGVEVIDLVAEPAEEPTPVEKKPFRSRRK